MISTPTQEWSAKITAWQQSGMTLAGWCREHTENYHRFLYWRKRLAAPVPGRFLELTVRRTDPPRMQRRPCPYLQRIRSRATC